MPALDKLLKGYRQFSEGYFSDKNPLHDQLAKAQNPEVLMISCCDSRVDPAIILQANPGDLFSIRNVSNIVPPCCDDEQHHGVSSALEFGTKFLKVKHILIMGHAQCGGIQALLAGDLGEQDFISNWVSILDEAKAVAESKGKTADEKQRICELEGIKLSLKNLLGYSWVADRVSDGSLELHGWFYDFQNGELLGYDADSDAFKALV